eukprot:TRINITY_DN51954_c0_g1_i1.p1 TRINITY_DN51954_c0_g1~~TRINITY_DN51954_c0_g1_i1.p1  ORF type:complete len:500 (-),score=62.12 TRINITY_DN51954_c0_g1_i1:729-2228(-)
MALRNRIEDAEYMQGRDVPKLFNEMANALLKHRPEDVLTFLSHWINRKLWDKMEQQHKEMQVSPQLQQQQQQMHMHMQMQMQMHAHHMHMQQMMHMQRLNQAAQGQQEIQGSPTQAQQPPFPPPSSSAQPNEPLLALQQSPPPQQQPPPPPPHAANVQPPPLDGGLVASPPPQPMQHVPSPHVPPPLPPVEMNPRPTPDQLSGEFASPRGKFEILHMISEGHYGVVYKAIDMDTGKDVAVKKVPIEGDWVTTEYYHMLHCQEAPASRTVKALGCYYEIETDLLWIVMELLAESLESKQPDPQGAYLQEKNIKEIVLELVFGVSSLHECGRVHLDIKPANILWHPIDRNWKIADFGTMQVIGDKCIQLGDFCYMAPEVATSRGLFVDKSDIWSIGALALAMTDGNPPLHREEPALLMYIHDQTCMVPTFWEPQRWSDDFRDFVFQCFRKDTELRPSAKSLLNHPWLSSLTTGAPSAGPPLLPPPKPGADGPKPTGEELYV